MYTATGLLQILSKDEDKTYSMRILNEDKTYSVSTRHTIDRARFKICVEN